MRITGANGQPATIFGTVGTAGVELAMGVQVLTVDADGIAAIDSFMDPRVVARFASSP